MPASAKKIKIVEAGIYPYYIWAKLEIYTQTKQRFENTRIRNALVKMKKNPYYF